MLAGPAVYVVNSSTSSALSNAVIGGLSQSSGLQRDRE